VSRSRRYVVEELAAFTFLASAVPFGHEAPRLVWSQLFGNDHPVEIEVGFGKGTFLLASATLAPERNFFGIEVERKYQLTPAAYAMARSLTNVRVACVDAKEFLAEQIASDSIETLHVYFPDPWWKRKHHKRRLFTFDFALTCQRILQPGGVLRFATDVPAYYETVRETMRALPMMAESIPTCEPLGIETGYERKALDEGRAIHRANYTKPMADITGVNRSS